MLGLIKFGKTYQYWDTPDGKDCIKKTWFVTKYASIFGVILSSQDIVYWTKPTTFLAGAYRVFHFTFPTAAMGFAGAATTCMMVNLRGKDDCFNYFLGGATSAFVLGSYARNPLLGVGMVFVLGGFAMILKDAHNNKFNLLDLESDQRLCQISRARPVADHSLKTRYSSSTY